MGKISLLVGAGVGYTSIRLAKRVGPEGLVLATDIQPQMLRMLVGGCTEEGGARAVLLTGAPGAGKSRLRRERREAPRARC